VHLIVQALKLRRVVSATRHAPFPKQQQNSAKTGTAAMPTWAWRKKREIRTLYM
jgi:hypothetical protein